MSTNNPTAPVIVAMVDAENDVFRAVEQAMEVAGWREAIPEGAEIALKPNLGWDLFLPGAVTSPLVLEGVVRVLRERARRIYLVEADQVLVDCERALRQTHMDEICRRYGLEWVNLSRVPYVRCRVPDPLRIPELDLPEILTRTILVTVPVMKTHNKTVMSGAIKNQWGCLPKFRHNYHPVVHQVLRDLSVVLRPALSVMDATVALEGNGPKSGRPRVCDLVLASRDPVAVDTVAARIMGLNGTKIEHLDLCAAAGLGTRSLERIEVRDGSGAKRPRLPDFAFHNAHHNAVSLVENMLRVPLVERVVFHTVLLRPLCWGAQLWYLIWYYIVRGRRLRDAVLRRGRYWQTTHEDPAVTVPRTR